jgi:hypothetical protein
MTIQNGQPADATDVSKEICRTNSTIAVGELNAKKVGGTSYSVSGSYFVADVFTNESLIDSANCTNVEGYDDLYHYFYLTSGYDEFGDGSINGTLWKTTTSGTGSISELDGYLLLSNDSSANSYSVTATMITDLKSYSKDVMAKTKITQPGTGRDAALIITDGINSVTIDSWYRVSTDNIYEFWFNYVSDNVRVDKNGIELGGSPFDLSTLTKWQIKYQISYGGGSSTQDRTKVQYLRTIIDGETGLIFVTNNITGSETSSDFYAGTLGLVGTNILDYTITSAYAQLDATNWETLTYDKLKMIYKPKFTNTGSNFKLKILYDGPTTLTYGTDYTDFYLIGHGGYVQNRGMY